MTFQELKLPGAYLIEPELIQDERGFFARSWCQQELKSQGLDTSIAQCSVSFNLQAGTLRGLHFQSEPHAETKIVSCTRGSIYDVIVDLRPGSAQFKQWLAVELTANNRHQLYIPAGFAHGFQTLEANSEVSYQISEFYHPESAAGVRWNDPAFGIQWPHSPPASISSRDASYTNFSK